MSRATLIALDTRIETLRAEVDLDSTPATWTDDQRRAFAEIKADWDKARPKRAPWELVNAVDHAFGWGLLGLDKARETLAALLGSLKDDDALDALVYSVRALKGQGKRERDDHDPRCPHWRMPGDTFATSPPSIACACMDLLAMDFWRSGNGSGPIEITHDKVRANPGKLNVNWRGGLEYDPDRVGGGPFGRVVGGDPPPGFEGPPVDAELESWRGLWDDVSEDEPGYFVGIDHGVAEKTASQVVYFDRKMVRRTMHGWIGVDFDGTLATKARWPDLGEPVPAMIERVRAWLAAGIEVRIVSVRAREGHAGKVQDWLVAQGLPRLRVTAEKDAGMFQLWDDRAVRVEVDTGAILGPDPEIHASMRRK